MRVVNERSAFSSRIQTNLSNDAHRKAVEHRIGGQRVDFLDNMRLFGYTQLASFRLKKREIFSLKFFNLKEND